MNASSGFPPSTSPSYLVEVLISGVIYLVELIGTRVVQFVQVEEGVANLHDEIEKGGKFSFFLLGEK